MSGQTSTAPGRAVLLVTYYFPPAGGPGVQRMLKFAKYLPDFGWRPVVLTVREDAAYPVRDPSLARDLPEGIEVVRTPITEFYRAYRKMSGRQAPLEGTRARAGEGIVEKTLRLVRASLFVPDGRVGWLLHAVGPGIRLARSSGAAAIVSSGPPFTTNLIGARIASRTGLPCVQDFRDPWTRAPFYPSRPAPARRLDERLECSIVRKAARTVAVNRRILDDLAARCPGVERERLVTIPNGFDEEDFRGMERRLPAKLTLLHAGTLHAARDPAILREAVRRLCARDPGFAAGFEILMAGRVEPSVVEAFSQPPFGRLVRFLGYLPHEESLRLLRSVHYCLLLIGDEPEVRGMITGKVYEYLGSETPIVAIGPTDGEAAELIRRCAAGVTFATEDAAGLAEWLEREWRRHQGGSAPSIAPAAREIAAYGRRDLTRQLAEVLEKVAAHAGEASSG